MDEKTLTFYRENSRDMATAYDASEGGVSRYFPLAFLPGSRVLDIGCGSGRDAAILLSQGFDVRGIDPCREFIEHARAAHPLLADRVAVGQLPDLEGIDDGAVDGVLCSAVLMHLPEERLFDAAFGIRRVLKPGGRLLLSLPTDGTIDPVTRRDAAGRLFTDLTPERCQLLFERLGFRLSQRWSSPDALGRPHRQWTTMLLNLESGDGTRSIDRIERVLNRDRKVATYKLALFRALADLAMASGRLATWRGDGRVVVPIAAVAEKWVEYYWPLCASERFIPQIQAEKPGSAHQRLAFRSLLTELASLYGGGVGLARYTIDARSGSLSDQARALSGRLLATVCKTIQCGPVTHAGGAGTEATVFAYDSSTRGIVMDADLWRELSLMGPWIRDATILRWAELTARLSKDELQPSEVIDLLLVDPLPERSCDTARALYEALPGKECVWTCQRIEGARFEVDHVIPFALWRNNDLWNLLPATRAANNSKRDRLPTRRLLYRQRDSVTGYWEALRGAHPPRFEREACRFGGSTVFSGSDWQGRLFEALAEAVEVTAVQRGVERWQPEMTAPAVDLARAAAAVAAPAAQHAAAAPAGLVMVENPPARERYVTWVPFYTVEAAAGQFGLDQPATADEPDLWVEVRGCRLSQGMFALRVVGHSMEPRIPDGSVCLFRGGDALAGSRQGRILLVQRQDLCDPETGASYTVKLYSSTKVVDPATGAWEHERITLRPLNRSFEPIVLDATANASLRVLGEFVGTLP